MEKEIVDVALKSGNDMAVLFAILFVSVITLVAFIVNYVIRENKNRKLEKLKEKKDDKLEKINLNIQETYEKHIIELRKQARNAEEILEKRTTQFIELGNATKNAINILNERISVFSDLAQRYMDLRK